MQPDGGTEPSPASTVTAMQRNLGTPTSTIDYEFKQHAIEVAELHGEVIDVKVDNIMHAGKIHRTGELHISRAKAMLCKVKAEELKLTREANANNQDGIKKISRAI